MRECKKERKKERNNEREIKVEVKSNNKRNETRIHKIEKTEERRYFFIFLTRSLGDER